jgi:hypothetical protein
MNLLNHVVLSTSHEYVGITTFFQCVSLIELNACKDDWLVDIEALQEGKNKAKKMTKKGKRKKKMI